MKIKRICLVVILPVVLACFLSACIVIPVRKHYRIAEESVSSVEIYDLNINGNYNSDFIKTEESVYTLEQDRVGDFLADLSKIRFSDTIIISFTAVDPNFTYDQWVARINYTDGSYDLISCDGYGEAYDKNGELTDSNHLGCDNDQWKQFIAKYIPEDVFEANRQEE